MTKKPIYEAKIRFRIYSARKEREQTLIFVYKNRYTDINLDTYLLNRAANKVSLKQNEEMKVIHYEPIKLIGFESYNEPLIEQLTILNKVRVKRKEQPCEECPASPRKESLNDEFNTIICPDCFDILEYSRIEGTTKASTKKVRKINPELDFDGSTSLPTEENGETKKKKSKPKIDRPGIELNKWYNEKCEETMYMMVDNQVDYSFTSPPYNIGKAIGGKKYKEFKDELTQQEYLEWQIGIINELLRVTKNHVFYNIQLLSFNKIALITLMEHFKYEIKDIAIWNKKIVPPASTAGVMNSKFEFIIIFSNKNALDRNFKDGNFHGNFNNIIEVAHDKNRYAKGHKAVFPIDLPRTFVLMFGKEGDTWYDPFGGTGTTAVACIKEKRNWVLSELSKEYCEEFIGPRIKNEMTGTLKLDLQ